MLYLTFVLSLPPSLYLPPSLSPSFSLPLSLFLPPLSLPLSPSHSSSLSLSLSPSPSLSPSKAAFLLPSITRLIRDNVQGASRDDDAQHIDVLIVSPTRELTLQIYNEARKFTHETIYRPVVVYGGTSVGHQLRQVENGCNILVGTPGRLIDFLNRRKVCVHNQH